MDGRVKTLHPAIFTAASSRGETARTTSRASGRTGSPRLTSSSSISTRSARPLTNPDTTFDALVEEIDIGGPSLVRAAAKNFRDVLVVVASAGLPGRARRACPRGRTVARVPLRPDEEGVHAHGAVRHGMIAMTHEPRARWRTDSRASAARQPGLPQPHRAPRDLRYGENPHQRAAWILRRRAPGAHGEVHRARSSRTRTCWTSTPRCGSRSSSPSRPRSSSSTPIRAASRPAPRSPTRTCAPAMPIRCRRSAASSG